MFESFENTFQIVILLICAGIAIYRAVVNRSRSWMILAFFYESWLLGDIYWLACLIFHGHTPEISFISDLSWFASYIFLYLLLGESVSPDKISLKHALPWLSFVFTGAMAIFYMQWGEVMNNLIYAVLMGLLIFSAISRLIDGKLHQLCVTVLVFCFLEYVLWTVSCFDESPVMNNLYYLSDILLTLCLPFFLMTTGKAVKA